MSAKHVHQLYSWLEIFVSWQEPSVFLWLHSWWMLPDILWGLSKLWFQAADSIPLKSGEQDHHCPHNKWKSTCSTSEGKMHQTHSVNWYRFPVFHLVHRVKRHWKSLWKAVMRVGDWKTGEAPRLRILTVGVTAANCKSWKGPRDCWIAIAHVANRKSEIYWGNVTCSVSHNQFTEELNPSQCSFCATEIHWLFTAKPCTVRLADVKA